MGPYQLWSLCLASLCEHNVSKGPWCCSVKLRSHPQDSGGVAIQDNSHSPNLRWLKCKCHVIISYAVLIREYWRRSSLYIFGRNGIFLKYFWSKFDWTLQYATCGYKQLIVLHTFWCWTLFHCMDILYLAYLFTSWYVFVLLLILRFHEQCSY